LVVTGGFEPGFKLAMLGRAANASAALFISLSNLERMANIPSTVAQNPSLLLFIYESILIGVKAASNRSADLFKLVSVVTTIILAPPEKMIPFFRVCLLVKYRQSILLTYTAELL